MASFVLQKYTNRQADISAFCSIGFIGVNNDSAHQLDVWEQLCKDWLWDEGTEQSTDILSLLDSLACEDC